MERGAVRAALAFIALIAFALRLKVATETPFWFDEAFSWSLSQVPARELIHRVALDNHSPLYFLLLRAWTRIAGTGVLAMRVPSIVLGVAGCLALYPLCARAIGGRRGQVAGLFAALFASCAGLLVSVGAEARMYPLALFAVALASLLLLRALDEPDDVRAWAWYGAAAALSFYAHYFSVFVIGAHVLYAAGVAIAQRRVPLPALAAPAVFLVLTGPWLPTVLAQRSLTAVEWWAPPFTFDWASLLWLFVLTGRRLRPAAAVRLLADAASLAMLVFLFVRATGRERLLAVLAFTPFLLSALASIQGPNLVVLHYLSFSILFVCAAAAALISRLPGRALPGLAGALLALQAGRVALTSDSLGSPDYGQIAAHLAAEQRGAPVIIDPFDYFPLRYYAPDAQWLVYGSDGKVPRYHGAALLSERDRVVAAPDLAALRGRFLVVENLGGFSNRRTPVPAGARARESRTFGTGRDRVVVTAYDAAVAAGH